MDRETAEERVVAAADRLFYESGIQAVGMDAIRDASGVSLKRLYQLFPAKDHLVVAVLQRRDRAVLASVAQFTSRPRSPEARILAIYDWLQEWFEEPGFRGCGFINTFGEIGPSSLAVSRAVEEQKRALRDHIVALVVAADRPAWIGDALAMLANGAMVTAAILGSAEPARHARAAAKLLLDATGAVHAGGAAASRVSPG